MRGRGFIENLRFGGFSPLNKKAVFSGIHLVDVLWDTLPTLTKTTVSLSSHAHITSVSVLGSLSASV